MLLFIYINHTAAITKQFNTPFTLFRLSQHKHTKRAEEHISVCVQTALTSTESSGIYCNSVLKTTEIMQGNIHLGVRN
jgi:hypothetical protein